MPEIWLSYGTTEVVLDILAENLDKKIEPKGTNLTDTEINSKLAQLDLTKPADLVILDHSKAVHKLISILFEKCNQQSIPKPKLFVDKPHMHLMKSVLSDPTLEISEFNSELP